MLSSELVVSIPVDVRQAMILEVGIKGQKGSTPFIITDENRLQDMTVFVWNTTIKKLEGILAIREDRVNHGDVWTYKHAGHLVPAENLAAARAAIMTKSFEKSITLDDLAVLEKLHQRTIELNSKSHANGRQPRFNFNQLQIMTGFEAPDLRRSLARLTGGLLGRTLTFNNPAVPESMGFERWFIPSSRQQTAQLFLAKKN